MIGVGFSSSHTPVAELFDQLPTSDGVLALQVFGPITALLSVMGISAATLDLKLLLLLFSALVLVEFVALMVVASPLLQVQAELDGAVDEVFLNATPLHKTDPFVQEQLNKLQVSDSCCGLRSYQDWRSQLPASCLCTPTVSSGQSDNSSATQGPCVPVGANDHPAPDTHENLWVHSQPCGPVLKSHLSFPIKLRIGIISAFATIAVFAFALCLVLGSERFWAEPAVETTVDGFNRVKYQPKPSNT